MNRFISELLAVVSAGIISVQTAGALTSWAEDTTDSAKTVKVSFNTEGVSFSEKTDPDNFLSKETTENYAIIPQGILEKEGYIFNGWTVDGFYAYTAGESYNFPDDVSEIVFEPIWENAKDTDLHNLTYSAEYGGEPIERPSWLKDMKAPQGRVIEPDSTEIKIDGAFSRGWTDGLHTFGYAGYGHKFIMPKHDVVLTPIWFKVVQFTFYAGDVDRLNGNDTYTFSENEASSTELAKADRFSRNGFNITGWRSDYDGEIYQAGQTVTVPNTDVTFTAVWSPKEYTVVFRQKDKTTIKVKGLTDTAIICPEPTETVSGMYFAGWKFADDGKTYKSGEEFVIKGALPGLGISLDAVWTSEPPEEDSAVYGDANGDGKVTLADCVAVLQYIANSEKYPLTETQKKSADVDGAGGITGSDALTIQKYDSGEITELPLK